MYIVKIGGGAAINIEGIVADLAAADRPFIIVHGANALRDEIAQKLGMEKTILTSVSGYSSVFSDCLLYTSPSPRDATLSRMPSSA